METGTIIATVKNLDLSTKEEITAGLSAEEKLAREARNSMLPEQRFSYHMRTIMNEIVAIKGVTSVRRVIHRELFQFQVDVEGPDRHAIVALGNTILAITLISTVDTYIHDSEFFAVPPSDSDSAAHDWSATQQDRL
ncbi:MAG TPA: hypothetical protein VG917_03885 [Patescibacteria group bacterium]|nr:hypothetical protein [Patescibacteria group bacterium]